jgi:MOSC domain-containing protein YiiM
MNEYHEGCFTQCRATKAVIYQGRTITSGIFKQPVERRLRVTALNLEGVEQADLTVHGGPAKPFIAKAAATGFYCAVLREGEIGQSDKIEFLGRDQNKITVADITRIYAFDKGDTNTLRRAMQIKALPENWRAYFRDRLGKMTQQA